MTTVLTPQEDLADELRNFEELTRLLKPSPGKIPSLPGIDIYGVSIPLKGVIGGDQRRMLGRGKILDGQQATVRRHHAIDRGHRDVRALPLRLTQPLISPGWTNDDILSNGVVVRAVIVLFPVVCTWQLGLDRYRPLAVLFDRRGPKGPKHSH